MLSLQSISVSVINEFYKKHCYSARASKTDWCIGGYASDTLIIAGRLIDYSDIYWLRSLFCDPDVRRCGYGNIYLTSLQNYLVKNQQEQLKNQGITANPKSVKPIVAFAEVHLKKFYETAGWQELPKPHNEIPITLAARIKRNSVFASNSQDSI